MRPAPVPSVVELFGTAQDSKDAAAAAAKAAEGAVEAATEAAGKLTTLMVNGDSMTATANAQAVLGAQITADEAATNAETALQDAKDALDEAKKSAADNASLIAALDAAIIEAEKAVVMTTDARDGEALTTAVEKVSGNDPEAKGYPMTPAQHGKAAAMDVGGALMPNTDMDGGRSGRAPHTTPAAADALLADSVMNAVRMDDHTGKTWAEIVGDDALKDMRIADLMTGNSKAVKAASIAGMAITSVTGLTAGATITDGLQYAGTYKEIEGVVFCAGADCKVEGEMDREKLTGSWYFTPLQPKYYYEKVVGDDIMYMRETAYAEFGHWLTVVPNADAIMVNTYARTADTEILPNWTADDEMLTDTSATYSGDAVGMSVHRPPWMARSRASTPVLSPPTSA